MEKFCKLDKTCAYLTECDMHLMQSQTQYDMPREFGRFWFVADLETDITDGTN